MSKYVRPEIVAMAGYVSGEQSNQAGVAKLNTNENPYRASERVYEAIADAARLGLAKYPNATAQPFREAAAKLYGVEPDWVLCGNGSDDILTILTRTFVGEKGRIRLSYPTYILYKTLAELQGATCEMVHFRPDWTLPPEFGCFLGKGEKTGAPRLAFLANPNSPSGTVVSNEQIFEAANSLPCPLVVDEAYAEFAGVSCMDLVKKCEKIICIRTLSKAYSLAGLRFGYAIAQPHLIEQMMKVRDSYNCDALSIAAATAAISDQDWLTENRRKILATRERLVQGMRQLGFDVVDSHANFTWNTHPTLSGRDIYEHLKANNVLIRYMNYPDWGDGIRISVGTDEQMDRCLSLVAEIATNRNKK